MLRLAADENFNNDIVRGFYAGTPMRTSSESKTRGWRERMTRWSWSGRRRRGGYYSHMM